MAPRDGSDVVITNSLGVEPVIDLNGVTISPIAQAKIAQINASQTAQLQDVKLNITAEEELAALEKLRRALAIQQEDLKAQQEFMRRVVKTVGAPNDTVTDQTVVDFFADLEEIYRRGQKLIARKTTGLSKEQPVVGDPDFWLVFSAYLADRKQKTEAFFVPFHTPEFKEKLQPFGSGRGRKTKAGKVLEYGLQSFGMFKYSDPKELAKRIDALQKTDALLRGETIAPNHQTMQDICKTVLATAPEGSVLKQPKIKGGFVKPVTPNPVEKPAATVAQPIEVALAVDPKDRPVVSRLLGWRDRIAQLRTWLASQMVRDLSAFPPAQVEEKNIDKLGFMSRLRNKISATFKRNNNAMNAQLATIPTDDTVRLITAGGPMVPRTRALNPAQQAVADAKLAAHKAKAELAKARTEAAAARRAVGAARIANLKNRGAATGAAVKGVAQGVRAGFRPVTMAKEKAAKVVVPSTGLWTLKGNPFAKAGSFFGGFVAERLAFHAARVQEKADYNKARTDWSQGIEAEVKKSLGEISGAIGTDPDNTKALLFANMYEPAVKKTVEELKAKRAGELEKLKVGHKDNLRQLRATPFKAVAADAAQKGVVYGKNVGVSAVATTMKFGQAISGFFAGLIARPVQEAVGAARSNYQVKRGITPTPST